MCAIAPGLADVDKILATVVKTGFTATVSTADTHAEEKARKLAAYRAEVKRFWIAAALTLPLVGQMLFMFGSGADVHADVLPRWLQFALATPVQFWIGWRFYVGGFNAMRGGSGNMDVLVALGTTMAWVYSAVVTVARPAPACLFRGLGDGHHAGAAGQDPRSARQGQDLGGHRGAGQAAAADRACRARWRNWSKCRSATLIPGDVFVVRAGEAVPVDGEVIEGTSSANEAMLTGESLPVAKGAGDKVFAATINGDGLLRCQATGVGSHTLLAGIIRLVEQAQGSKAPVQRLADRIAAIFVPVVTVIALAHLRRLVVVRRRLHAGAGQCRRRAGDRLPVRARVWRRRRRSWSAPGRAPAPAC